MPAYTSPDNIQYPVSTDAVAPLETVFANVANSTQDALDGLRIEVDGQLATGVATFADATARDVAITSPSTGDRSRILTEAFDRVWNGSSWVPYGSGEYPILGTVGGGTQDMSTGLITFSAASALTLDGFFTTTFRRYRIILDCNTSATANLTGTLRASGSASSTGYDAQYFLGINATASASQGLNGSSWSLTASSAQHFMEMVLIRPALAVATLAQSNSSSTQNPMAADSTSSTSQRLFQHRSATAYDGIGFTPASGTITGTAIVTGIL